MVDQNKLRSIVFHALDNAVENGYPVSDDELKEAQDLLDQDADLADLFGIRGVFPGINEVPHAREVMKM